MSALDPGASTGVPTRRALAWLVRVALRADPVRTALVLLPVGPLGIAGMAVGSAVAVEGSFAGDGGQVVGGAALAGLSLALFFAASYLQAATAVLRLRESTGRRIDAELLDLVGGVATLEPFEDDVFADRVEQMRTGKGPLAGAAGIANQIVVAGGLALAAAALLASVRPAFALVVAAVVPLAWVSGRSQAAIATADALATGDDRVASALFDVGTGVSPAKELRVFGTKDLVRRMYAARAVEAEQRRARAELRAATARTLVWAVFVAAVAVQLVAAVRAAAAGTLGPGETFLVVLVTLQLADQATLIAAVVADVRQSLELAGRFVWLADHADARRANPPAAPVGRQGDAPSAGAPLTALRDGIELRGVGFRHPGAAHAALSGVDLHLPAGSVVGIVGENGAGKSTLVRLLLALYRPTEGTLLVDGREIATVPVADWHRSVTAVFQDFVRFELLAREAVGVGDLGRVDDEPAVLDAVARARAGGVVESLPGGLETQLGATLGGADLSTGQWQQLAVARGMMRSPVLAAFDEPTVSLDARRERDLFDAFIDDARRGNRHDGGILVLVSHRLSTMVHADLIVVLDRGRVVERGSHVELLAADGAYAEAFRAQADAYR